jgi:hypothetical protein
VLLSSVFLSLNMKMNKYIKRYVHNEYKPRKKVFSMARKTFHMIIIIVVIIYFMSLFFFQFSIVIDIFCRKIDPFRERESESLQEIKFTSTGSPLENSSAVLSLSVRLLMIYSFVYSQNFSRCSLSVFLCLLVFRSFLLLDVIYDDNRNWGT